MFSDTLWDTPELKQATLTWHRDRDRRREGEKRTLKNRKGATESTWVGSVKRSGVQLLTPLHTQLQKNRTARSGLNWCTHIHLHWWDNWTDWPLKWLLKWPEPQQGKSLSFSLFTISQPLNLACTITHTFYIVNIKVHADWSTRQDTFNCSVFNQMHRLSLNKTSLLVA